MKLLKVNNFGNYLILRTFLSLTICYLTYSITGRIADSEALLGIIDYDAGGSRTLAATRIYSLFSNFNSLFIIIFLLIILSSLLIFYLIRNYIDNHNVNYWYLLLITPGILLYSNSPTKETLVFYPAIAVTILECNSLLNWRKWNTNQKVTNSIFKIVILLTIIILRGDLGLIYTIISFLIFLLSNIYIKPFEHKINIVKTIFTAFIISNITLLIINNLYPFFLKNIINYLILSFGGSSSLSRNYIDYEYLINPLNSLKILYLGLFPTINELIRKPYTLLIIIESSLYIFLYYQIWTNLFKIVQRDIRFKTLLYFIFIFITVSYFIIYSNLSVFNLGSGQRFKVNFIPVGIIFPLILEKKIRNLKFLDKDY